MSESFTDLWNDFRNSRRLRNYEIEEGTGHSGKLISSWNMGHAEPRGEQRRAVVRYVGRFDRTLAGRIATVLGIGAEIDLLLNGPSAPSVEPDIDYNAVAGDLFLVAEQVKLPPRDIQRAVAALIKYWHARGHSTRQLAAALDKIAAIVPPPPTG